MADNPKNEIDEELVRHLTRLLGENNLTEIEYGRDGWHIKVGRGGGVTVSESRRGNLEPEDAPGTSPGASEDAAPGIDVANAVTSPMVGVVFTASDPETPPFVNAGDEVTEGQTLLLIESMNDFNTKTAPRSGTVTKILITNGAPVEFGEPLLILE